MRETYNSQLLVRKPSRLMPRRTIPVESKLTWPVCVTHHVAARSRFVRRSERCLRLTFPGEDCQDSFPGADLPREPAPCEGAVKDGLVPCEATASRREASLTAASTVRRLTAGRVRGFFSRSAARGAAHRSGGRGCRSGPRQRRLHGKIASALRQDTDAPSPSPSRSARTQRALRDLELAVQERYAVVVADHASLSWTHRISVRSRPGHPRQRHCRPVPAFDREPGVVRRYISIA